MPTFEELYSNLNSNQKLAVDTIEGPVMVVAGPGTGKTSVLTLRIANILRLTDTEPSNILALTFTESAVANIRSRLVDLIATPGYKVEIATFHSFCNDIIQTFPEDFAHMISSVSITELEQIEIVEQLILKQPLNLLRPFGDSLYYLRPILSAINELKREGVTADDFEQAVILQKKNFDKIEDLYHEKGAYKGSMKGKYQDLERSIAKNVELVLIYQKYQEILLEKKFYDFNDMLLEVLSSLNSNPGLLLSLQEKYQYILVDEHQDTNTAQNKIIELLASFHAPSPNLFVVGDEKQAIFRFQGATIENFLFFKNLYPHAKLINLTENYRSNQTILDAATSMVANNVASNAIFPDSLKLQAKSEHGPMKLRVLETESFFGEYQEIGDQIAKLLEQTSASEIAVIARNNRDLNPLMDVLIQHQIPFVLESDSNAYSDEFINKLIIILRAIRAYDFDLNSNLDLELVKCLHIDTFEIVPFDVYKILNKARGRGPKLATILHNKKLLKDIELEAPERLQDFVTKFKNWVNVAANSTFENLFVTVLNESGIKQQILQSPQSNQIMEKLAMVFEDTKMQVSRNPKFSLSDFIGYLDLIEKHHILIKARTKPLKSSVRLMTAHKSKGLEFDYVFVLNCFDGHWGNQRKRAVHFNLPWSELGIKYDLGVELDIQEDERRLFFVSLTRARKQVFLSYSRSGLEGREQLPSQFIEEIDPMLIERQFVAKKESETSELLRVPMISRDLVAEKEFFNNIFVERGLSVTGLNNFLDCPWKYFYRNLLQLPDIKTRSLIFGSAVHKAISTAIKSIKSGNNPDLGLMQKSFQDYLDTEAMTEADYLDLTAKGQKVLSEYFEAEVKNWNSERESEQYIRGVELAPNIHITGIIDMIEPADPDIFSNASNPVRVTDFKTGKPKTRSQIDEDSDYNYERQLTFYKILLDNSLNKKMTMTQGVIDFVEIIGEKHKKEIFNITDEQVLNLKQIILKVSEQILGLTFWDQFCDKPDCEYCALRKSLNW